MNVSSHATKNISYDWVSGELPTGVYTVSIILGFHRARNGSGNVDIQKEVQIVRTFIVSLIIIALIVSTEGAVTLKTVGPALMSVLYVGDIGDAPVRLYPEMIIVIE